VRLGEGVLRWKRTLRGGFLAARHRQLCVVPALEHIDILALSTRPPRRPATKVMNEMRGGG
jgi:hypothetical protein